LFIQNLSGEGTPGANNNIQFDLGTTASPSTKMTINGDGNVGIGTISPQARLHVSNPAGSVSQRIETGGGVNAWTKVEFANANGQWNVGTSLGFNGDELYFHREGAANIAFAIQPNGDVGIGTTTPGARLHAETASAFTAAIYGNATGAGGVGVYGQGASGTAVFADGDARQTRDKGGFVKAMIFVRADGTIVRGFNSFLDGAAATTPPCGFTSTRLDTGQYLIDFGFQVSDRFFTVTPQAVENAPGSIVVVYANFSLNGVTSNQVKVYTAVPGLFFDAPFMVIIY
jgi:hypothetical protein